jgi:hypothetical protein
MLTTTLQMRQMYSTMMIYLCILDHIYYFYFCNKFCGHDHIKLLPVYSRRSHINVTCVRSPSRPPETWEVICMFIVDPGLINVIYVTGASANRPTWKTIFYYTQVGRQGYSIWSFSKTKWYPIMINWLLLKVQRAVFQLYSGRENQYKMWDENQRNKSMKYWINEGLWVRVMVFNATFNNILRINEKWGSKWYVYRICHTLF